MLTERETLKRSERLWNGENDHSHRHYVPRRVRSFGSVRPQHSWAPNDPEDTVNGRAGIHQRVEKTRYRLPSPGVTLRQITGYQAEVWWLLIPAKRNEPANIPSAIALPVWLLLCCLSPRSPRERSLFVVVVIVGVPRVKRLATRKPATNIGVNP